MCLTPTVNLTYLYKCSIAKGSTYRLHLINVPKLKEDNQKPLKTAIGHCCLIQCLNTIYTCTARNLHNFEKERKSEITASIW